MVEISIRGSTLYLEVLGLHKVWAMTGHVEVPLLSVKSVRIDPAAARERWKGWRMGGTSVPGLIDAGRFRRDQKWDFWDVHNPDNTLVIELEGQHYSRLVVEVASPEASLTMIRDALAAHNPR